LHVHSTASDGVLTPSEVVRLAQDLGLTAIALTDHDTTAGVSEAEEAANGSLEIIPGIEINSEGDWGDLHFLGYYIDPQDAHLQELLEAVRDARVGRARAMVLQLNRMGMRLEWERVRAFAVGESVGRPHVARALVEGGYVRNVQEAFDRFIGNDGPAYVPRLRLMPAETIRAILEAGGIPVIAHPAYSGQMAVSRIPEFAEYGLRGVEVFYPGHTDQEVAMLQALCQKHDLLVTGGSDFHGPSLGEGSALGSIFVPPECLDRLHWENRHQAIARGSPTP
jgi:predicted metal-dependent phosphoesterase TrpH